MILRLEIPDALYELYSAHARGDESKVPALLVQQLDRFRRVSLTDRILIIDPHHRAKLEELLSHPTPQIADAKDLLARVDALAHIEIGGVAVRFNQRDLTALASYAEKNNLSVQEAVEYTVQRMKDNFMSYAPEATAAAAMPLGEAPEEVEAAPSAPPLPDAVIEEVDVLAAAAVPPQVVDPRAMVGDPDAGYEEEGRGRLLNPSTVDPADQKIQPRKPTPHVHPKRRVNLQTPAETGDAPRPAGYGAGSRG